MENRKKCFTALVRRVRSLNGIASAVVAAKFPRPGCPAGPKCLCGRHAVAAFKVIEGKDDESSIVLARNSHGNRNPIVEISLANLAWWMTLNPVVKKVWNSKNREEKPLPITKWFSRWMAQNEGSFSPSSVMAASAAAKKGGEKKDEASAAKGGREKKSEGKKMQNNETPPPLPLQQQKERTLQMQVMCPPNGRPGQKIPITVNGLAKNSEGKPLGVKILVEIPRGAKPGTSFPIVIKHKTNE